MKADPSDRTVDSSASHRLSDADGNEDEELETASPLTEPRHIVRENVEAISEDEPPPPRESDATLPAADVVMPDVDLANEKWRAEIRDAAVRWERLTEEDLLALDKHQGSLTELVQKRYMLSAEETTQQVSDFIADHQTFLL